MKTTTGRIKRVPGQPKKARNASSAAAWLDYGRLAHKDVLRSSVLTRIAPAVVRLVEATPEHELLEALSTNTGMDALIHLVSSDAAAVEAASNVEDPLREAKARAANKFAELLAAEGGPVGV